MSIYDLIREYECKHDPPCPEMQKVIDETRRKIDAAFANLKGKKRFKVKLKKQS